MMLVSLEAASAHLRRDTTDDDTDLLLKIRAASSAVVRYLGDGASMFLDSNGNPDAESDGVVIDVPEDIQIATLMLIGDLYKNREGSMDGQVDPQFGYGYLPIHVIALLYPYRTPTIA
jgi:hypothetical protein